MSRSFLLAWAGGLAVVAVLIASVFYAQRGDHLAPNGNILRVRSVAADPQRSIAVLDLRIQNNSNVAVEVRNLEANMELKDGRGVEGVLIASSDAKQLFQYYPALGELYNEPLVSGSRVPAHQSLDRTLAARFDVPEQEFDSRRKLGVAVQDRSMLKFELLEKRR